jgi:hypothetical protein
VRDVLQPADLLRRHGHAVVSARDLDESAKGVVGLGGDPHACKSARPVDLTGLSHTFDMLRIAIVGFRLSPLVGASDSPDR